ncbi:MAG: hypothetical protein Q9160_006392 [Pyrenula sp. 1 TL-2023]
MSADLLAAFGNPQEQATIQKPSLDFTASVHDNRPRGQTSDASGIHATQKPTEQLKAREKPEDPLWHKDAGGADVLFDADDDIADEDDFGDFEAADNDNVLNEPDHAIPEAPTRALDYDIDLLGLEDVYQVSTKERPGTESSPTGSATNSHIHRESQQENSANFLDDDYGGVSNPKIASNAATKPQLKEPATPLPSQKLGFGQVKSTDPTEPVEEDDWGDFSQAPAPPPQPRNDQDPPPQLNPEPQDEDEDEAWEPFDTSDQSPPPKHPPTPAPPTSPPPSLLLSLLPPIFTSLHASLPSLQTPSPSSISPSDLRTLIPLSHATAHRLISGRLLRWKRDTHLSQSMRIGPSTRTSTLGGKSGGMKLSSLDKTESRREEREVAEVVEAWRGGAWGFNSFLKREGKGRGRGLVGLREEGGRVRVLEGEGVRREKRECALCGLRREERVEGVDDQEGGEDVFGEWWVGYWGHRECREWWERYEEMLRER